MGQKVSVDKYRSVQGFWVCLTIVSLVGLFLFLATRVRAGTDPALEATDLANHGQYEQAIAKFQEAIQGDPRNARLYLGLGLVYQSFHRYAQAVQALEQAVQLSPSLAEAHYSLALLYEAMAIDPSLVGGGSDQKSLWKKAEKSWNGVVQWEKDSSKKTTARKHLMKIQEELGKR